MTFTTLPGIGASSEPLATCSDGSRNRGTRTSRRWPDGASTSTVSRPGRPVTEVAYVVATPSRSIVTLSGVAATTLTPSAL